MFGLKGTEECKENKYCIHQYIFSKEVYRKHIAQSLHINWVLHAVILYTVYIQLYIFLFCIILIEFYALE